jgi:prevent-host-death family protein
MQIVNVHAAKTRLSSLLESMEAGEEVVIARAGHPVARLVPYVEAAVVAEPGAMAGKIVMADDFDAPLDPLFICMQDKVGV